jgi:hypothetical protein
MKRKLKWIAAVLAVSLLGFGTALLLWPRDRITAESWQKIRIGITEEQAAEILGNPGMNYEKFVDQYVGLEKELGRPPCEIELPTLEQPEGKRFVEERTTIWTGRRGMIVIEFDQDNHVCWKHFQGYRWINGGILDRFRDWLGW